MSSSFSHLQRVDLQTSVQLQLDLTSDPSFRAVENGAKRILDNQQMLSWRRKWRQNSSKKKLQAQLNCWMTSDRWQALSQPSVSRPRISAAEWQSLFMSTFLNVLSRAVSPFQVFVPPMSRMFPLAARRYTAMATSDLVSRSINASHVRQTLKNFSPAKRTLSDSASAKATIEKNPYYEKYKASIGARLR